MTNNDLIKLRILRMRFKWHRHMVNGMGEILRVCYRLRNTYLYECAEKIYDKHWELSQEIVAEVRQITDGAQ